MLDSHNFPTALLSTKLWR